jgi:uncharacterized protein (TIGR03437 family)
MRTLTLIPFLTLALQPLAGAVAPWPSTGWSQSTPEDQGMNSAILQDGGDFVLSQCPNRYSFLVVRNGYLVWEQYFHGMSRETNAHVMSISKSVLSMMIGQALDQGKIEGLDRKLVDYFPEYFSPSTDPRKREITLRNMLMMEAGFQWDEVTSGNAWTASKDWYKFVIDLPLAASPGEVFDYNTGLSHLLAGVLSRAADQSAYAFGIQNLFNPLGIWNFRWETDPRGNFIGGFRMYFTSRDLAKFGYLALRKGYWEDRQLVSRQWVEESTTAKVFVASPTTTGDYAYHWWSRPQYGYPVFMAAGFGGQYIFVVPGLDLIMVSTADTTADTVDRHMQAFNLLTQYVIPAIKSVNDAKVAGKPHVNAVVNGASFAAGTAPGAWTTILGTNLSTATREWSGDDIIGGVLPAQLENVSVTIGGKPAYVGYVSPTQLNVIAPAGVSSGSASVIVTPAAGYSTTVTTTVNAAAPALFPCNNTPVRPGDVVVLYGTGFVADGLAGTIGEVAREAAPLASLPVVTIGGRPAVVEWAGIPKGSAGLYQINVRVPESAAEGDLPVVVTDGQVPAPPVFIKVKNTLAPN